MALVPGPCPQRQRIDVVQYGRHAKGKQHTQKLERQPITFRTRLKRLAKLSQRNSNLPQ